MAINAIIDISEHDKTIDFALLHPNISLVIARVSCGGDLDKQFIRNASEMNARGIPFGVYCYSYAKDNLKAEDEAMKMFEYAKNFNPLFYVIDVEKDFITSDTIVCFAKKLRSLGVKKVGCYVSHKYYNKYCFDTIRELFDFVWISRYGSNDGTLEGSIKPKYDCDLWQFTSKASMDGINHLVDQSVLAGSKTLSFFIGEKKSNNFDIFLRNGNKGDSVKYMQCALIALGYDLGKCGADGSFGKATLKAVNKFQEDRGYIQTGTVTKYMYERIFMALTEKTI